MIPEDEENDVLDPDWKPFEVYMLPDSGGKWQATMLGSTSELFNHKVDALEWALAVLVDAWLHHINIEHDDLEEKVDFLLKSLKDIYLLLGS